MPLEKPLLHCNKCGKFCDTEYSRDNLRQETHYEPDPNYGLLEAKAQGHYFSDDLPHGLEDMTVYTFSMCEKCLTTLFASFIIPVQKEYL